MKRRSEMLKAFLGLFRRIYRLCSDYLVMLVCIVYGLAFTAMVGDISFSVLTFLFLCTVYSAWECEKLLLRQKGKIPMVRKRFTYKEGDAVCISKKDIEQALLYLYNVENYIEENHLRE